MGQVDAGADPNSPRTRRGKSRCPEDWVRPAKPMLTTAIRCRTVMEPPCRGVRDDKDRPDLAPWKLNAVVPYGFGAAALFSGMALVAHILSRVPLRLLLATTIGLAAIAVR